MEDVDAKADGEGIALPSYYPVDGDGYVYGEGYGYRDIFGDENDGRGGRYRPCASARFQRRTLKKNISHEGICVK